MGANEGLGGLGGGVSMITSGSCCAQSRCCSSPSSIVVRKPVSVRGRMLMLCHMIREEKQFAGKRTASTGRGLTLEVLGERSLVVNYRLHERDLSRGLQAAALVAPAMRLHVHKKANDPNNGRSSRTPEAAERGRSIFGPKHNKGSLETKRNETKRNRRASTKQALPEGRGRTVDWARRIVPGRNIGVNCME